MPQAILIKQWRQDTILSLSTLAVKSILFFSETNNSLYYVQRRRNEVKVWNTFLDDVNDDLMTTGQYFAYINVSILL